MYYDVIVIGGGHAGAEAANASARAGAHTMLVTSFLARIGQMSCNPAIGGVAKGTVVREVDAMGGVMGRAADRTTLHFRMLNRSKGPAVWAPRAQCDRSLYARTIRELLEEREGLEFYQGTVAALLLEGDRVTGVRCSDGTEFAARAVVLTAGTFLRGSIRMGLDVAVAGGRAGDAPSVELADQLRDLGLEAQRFKTGTPPRVDGRGVDFSLLQRQDGESEGYRFSHWEAGGGLTRRPCWIARTGDELKEVVQRSLERSALYGGEISSRGPRYCPSIEDKVVKFPDASGHHVFLEPEGLETRELYVNGLSTSLPPAVQREFLRHVPGLRNARMTQPGYAIEYDYFPPLQLEPSLALKLLCGLYMAGQINGTTGYEEAAAQGLVGGLNAARDALDLEPWIPRRDESYIGVLVDDLVTRGVDEPYRLFTSRAEFRLILRQDNALSRLGPAARNLKLLVESEWQEMERHLESLDRARTWVAEEQAHPELFNGWLEGKGESSLVERQPLSRLLRRPGIRLADLVSRSGPVRDPGLDVDVLTAVEMEVKYDGYIRREEERVASLAAREGVQLPQLETYMDFRSLSYEARQKLDRVRPLTLGQASRIPGVSPTDLQNLLVELRKRGLEGRA
jgi:tRNA uridine 5-carboxymethylaminomethyl modification enzyme